jgi:hypothetical protein
MWHPELRMHGRRTVTTGMPYNPASPVYDRKVIVSILHVQFRELLPAGASTGNGEAVW